MNEDIQEGRGFVLFLFYVAQRLPLPTPHVTLGHSKKA